MADWIHGLIDRLRETQHEQVRLLNHIVGQQDQIIKLLELTAEPKSRNMPLGLDLTKLTRWPIPLYLISAGLLAANYKIPEVAELIKVFAGLQ